MTLVEVLVAAAVFGVAVLGIFGTADLMFRTSVRNVGDGVALHAAEGLMEQLRVMPYEATLLRLAKDPDAGALVFSRYDARTRTLISDSIPVNQEVLLSGVNLGVTLDSRYSVSEEAPLPMRVRVTLTPVEADFAAGVAVELFYRYGSGAESRRVLRTFIPSSVS